jgi:serine/threonine protein phosphatase PrpC
MATIPPSRGEPQGAPPHLQGKAREGTAYLGPHTCKVLSASTVQKTGIAACARRALQSIRDFTKSRPLLTAALSLVTLPIALPVMCVAFSQKELHFDLSCEGTPVRVDVERYRGAEVFRSAGNHPSTKKDKMEDHHALVGLKLGGHEFSVSVVCDGHGGAEASKLVSKRFGELFEEEFRKSTFTQMSEHALQELAPLVLDELEKELIPINESLGKGVFGADVYQQVIEEIKANPEVRLEGVAEGKREEVLTCAMRLLAKHVSTDSYEVLRKKDFSVDLERMPGDVLQDMDPQERKNVVVGAMRELAPLAKNKFDVKLGEKYREKKHEAACGTTLAVNFIAKEGKQTKVYALHVGDSRTDVLRAGGSVEVYSGPELVETMEGSYARAVEKAKSLKPKDYSYAQAVENFVSAGVALKSGAYLDASWDSFGEKYQEAFARAPENIKAALKAFYEGIIGKRASYPKEEGEDREDWKKGFDLVLKEKAGACRLNWEELEFKVDPSRSRDGLFKVRIGEKVSFSVCVDKEDGAHLFNMRYQGCQTPDIGIHGSGYFRVDAFTLEKGDVLSSSSDFFTDHLDRYIVEEEIRTMIADDRNVVFSSTPEGLREITLAEGGHVVECKVKMVKGKEVMYDFVMKELDTGQGVLKDPTTIKVILRERARPEAVSAGKKRAYEELYRGGPRTVMKEALSNPYETDNATMVVVRR